MANINIGSAGDRIFQSMQVDFEMFCHHAASELAGMVESEIELMVLATFAIASRLSPLKIVIGDKFPDDGSAHMLVTPQYLWNGHRIDFCVRRRNTPDQILFVECDGHDFHERTKEQAERDRSKDRAIQAAGIPILRFTGREIWRDPAAVCTEIFNFGSKR